MVYAIHLFIFNYSHYDSEIPLSRDDIGLGIFGRHVLLLSLVLEVRCLGQGRHNHIVLLPLPVELGGLALLLQEEDGLAVLL